MARGVARTINERIADLDVKIKKKQDEIKSLTDKRNELDASKKNEMASQVVQLAEEKGLTLDDVLDMIKTR